MEKRRASKAISFGFIYLGLVMILTVIPAASYDFSIGKRVIGPQNVFVITVEFPDKLASTDVSNVEERVFREINDYYQTVSYGKVTLTGNVSRNWVLMPDKMSHYGNFDNKNLHSPGAKALIDDAIKGVDALLDFSGFNYVFVVHAGEDEAYSKNVTDIWSWGFWEGLYAPSDEVTFNQGAVASEFDTLGTFSHEFGHILGLPDLYNYDRNSSETFVGKWDLMDYGDRNGVPVGSKPSQIMAWGKMFLGWINESQIMEILPFRTVNATLEPLEKLSPGIKVVKIPVAARSYYLIEVRTDESLPDQGVLIAFVNETKNNGEGIVKVIDSKLSTLSLDDAIFRVGEFFEEKQYRFSVKVMYQFENSSTSLQISNKLVPYINLATPSRAEACQEIHINVGLASFDGTPLQGLMTTLRINGEKYQTLISDTNGTATFTVNFNLLMTGKNLIEVDVIGGDDFIDNQAQEIIEVTFPHWLLELMLVLSALGIVCLILVIRYFKARRIKMR